MRSCLHVALPLVIVLAGCGDKSALPAGLAGNFAPQDMPAPSVHTHLNVTPTGLAVTRSGAAASGSVIINGEPASKGSAEAGSGSALFANLRCEDDHACTFTTKNGCEGSLNGDGKGNVVLIASGECSHWSGKWMADKDDAPHASPSPPATCPPCPQTPPPAASSPPSPAVSSPPPPSPAKPTTGKTPAQRLEFRSR